MNNVEFDTAFDVMYNNITSNQAPGLNLYEKSLFLTQAQSHIIREYFNSKIDQAGGGYDGNQKRQYDFSTITKHTELPQIEPTDKFDQRSFVYKFPDDWFLTLNEQLVIEHYESDNGTNVLKGTKYVPVRQLSMNEYDRLMSKPYKYPAKDVAWRIINDNSWSETVHNDDTDEDETTYYTNKPTIELIVRKGSTDTIDYRMRYVRKPKPIILEPRLDSYNVSIDGIGYGDGNTYTYSPANPTGLSTITECELPEILHKEILERAVVMAKSVWMSNTQQRSNQNERSER